MCGFWTSTHRGRSFPPYPPLWRRLCFLCRKSIVTLALSQDNREIVVRYFVNRAPIFVAFSVISDDLHKNTKYYQACEERTRLTREGNSIPTLFFRITATSFSAFFVTPYLSVNNLFAVLARRRQNVSFHVAAKSPASEHRPLNDGRTDGRTGCKIVN